MQLKSDTSYFFSKIVMLSIEPLLIFIWKHLKLFTRASYRCLIWQGHTECRRVCLSIFKLQKKTASLSCRCIWRVKDDDFDLSIKLIAAKRLRLDDELARIRGVHFFVSSLTGIMSNSIEIIS